MKLKNLKTVEKLEDLVVFKALLRCMKERGTFNYLKKRFKTCEAMKNSAYNSRHNHQNEDFLTNISYWPTDLGLGDFTGGSYILYFSMLVNNIDIKKHAKVKSEKNNLNERLRMEINTLFTATYYYINTYSLRPNIFREGAYDEIIAEALEKIDYIKGNKKEDYLEALKLIEMIFQEKLPL